MNREVQVRFCEGLGLKCPGLLSRRLVFNEFEGGSVDGGNCVVGQGAPPGCGSAHALVSVKAPAVKLLRIANKLGCKAVQDGRMYLIEKGCLKNHCSDAVFAQMRLCPFVRLARKRPERGERGGSGHVVVHSLTLARHFGNLG